MKIILIILAIMAGLLMIVYIPWLIGGAAVVVFCFWNEWYIAGVIAGLFAIFCQILCHRPYSRADLQNSILFGNSSCFNDLLKS